MKGIPANISAPQLPLTVAARRPRSRWSDWPAWAILERLRSLDDETLTQFPDLAQALAGWEDACGRIEARALARWRRAAVEAMWWRGLCRVPPPSFAEVRRVVQDTWSVATGAAQLEIFAAYGAALV